MTSWGMIEGLPGAGAPKSQRRAASRGRERHARERSAGKGRDHEKHEHHAALLNDDIAGPASKQAGSEHECKGDIRSHSHSEMSYSAPVHSRGRESYRTHETRAPGTLFQMRATRLFAVRGVWWRRRKEERRRSSIIPMNNLKYDQDLAQAIVDTIREPLLVLDAELRVVAASRSFYSTFKVAREVTDGRLLYELGDGQWRLPALREQLERIATEGGVLDGHEVEGDFPLIGLRIMLLNARRVHFEAGARSAVLLAIEDVTERRAVERQRDDLIREKDLLLQEMQHRVANSLQIIASILLIKARTVTSEEIRTHLHDAHDRVLAVAAVQKHLHATVGAKAIELRPYLLELCKSLADSMISESQTIAVDVSADEGRASSSDAVSLGLIVTELMINALKHAFPVKKPGCCITVRFETNASGWRLSVSDNGVGKLDENSPLARVGLGTSIVAALAEQLHAQLDTTANASGTSVSVTHAMFNPARQAA